MEILRLRGVGVSPGIAMAEAVLTERVVFTSRPVPIPASPDGERDPALPRGLRADPRSS